jgi:purine nucleosidase
MLGLDVTRQAVVTAEMIRRAKAIGTPIAMEAANLLINYGSKDPCLHDLSAIAWMLAPGIFESVDGHVSICVESGDCYGQVVAAISDRDLAGRSTNCTIVTKVKAEAFEHLFIDAPSPEQH